MPRKTVVALAALWLLSGSAWGQQSLGSITGRVSDPQGGVIPGAQVVITHTDTNAITRVTTNATGYFESNFLQPGTYTVSVESTGFKKALRTGLELQVAGRLDLQLALEIGATAETV